MITTVKQLATLVQLNLKEDFAKNASNFPLRVTKSFVKRIHPGDINDPLLLQILPSKAELLRTHGFSLDPLHEKQYSPIPGLIHKYHGRILLLTTANCALNCRFCFRRHTRTQVTDWHKIFFYIKHDLTITEVILSGGDPLTLKPLVLNNIIKQLDTIPHIARIRIHTRMPIAMPESITTNPFPTTRAQLVIMIHCNHPQEINHKVTKALNLLRKQNILLLNQSVLLKSINNDSATLIALSEKLGDAGVIPIYLHLLDKVQGAAHFYVHLSDAKKIHLVLQKKLPGYLVPKLVVEIHNRKKHVI